MLLTKMEGVAAAEAMVASFVLMALVMVLPNEDAVMEGVVSSSSDLE